MDTSNPMVIEDTGPSYLYIVVAKQKYLNMREEVGEETWGGGGGK